VPIEDDEDFAPIYQVALSGAYSALSLRAGDFVLDAGANSGVFTALAARQVGPGGLVVAVEPDPANFAKLRRMVALNELRNVRLVQAALWPTDGAIIHLEGAGTMVHVSGGSLRGHTATTVSPSGLLNSVGVTQFQKVKMDIEGSEALLFQGAASAPLFRSEEVSVEVHGQQAREIVTRAFVAHGFRADRVVEGSEDFIALARGVLTHPVLSLELELLHRFKTTARVLRSSLCRKPTDALTLATIHFRQATFTAAEPKAAPE